MIAGEVKGGTECNMWWLRVGVYGVHWVIISEGGGRDIGDLPR